MAIASNVQTNASSSTGATNSPNGFLDFQLHACIKLQKLNATTMLQHIVITVGESFVILFY